ncbi:hypothetical protein HZS_1710 [Henneguya salminicola]|nr:hypothetical protein HZS_1710 [Henneguya salminicola]
MFTVYLLKIKKIFNWSDEYLVAFYNIDKNFERWNFLQNLYSINSLELMTSIKSYKDEIEHNSLVDWHSSFTALRKYHNDNINEKIKLTIFIILCSEYAIRMRRFNFNTLDIIFSTDCLIIEISDILSYISYNLNPIISFPTVIFTCIHIGACGPMIGYRALFSDPPLLEQSLKEIINLESLYLSHSQTFYQFLLLIYAQLPIISRLLIDIILGHQSLAFYALKLATDTKSPVNIRLETILQIMLHGNFSLFSQKSDEISLALTMCLTIFINKTDLDLKILETVRKILILFKINKIYIDSLFFDHIFRLLTINKTKITEIYSSLYSLLLYHYMFEVHLIQTEFTAWLSTVMSANRGIQSTAFNSDKFVSVLSSIESYITKSNFTSICEEMSEYFEFIITPDILLDNVPTQNLSTLEYFGTCVTDALSNLDTASSFTQFDPIPSLSYTTSSDSLRFLSKSSSLIFKKDINDSFHWVIAQIMSCATPIHPNIVALIDKLVKKYSEKSSKFPLKMCQDILLSPTPQVSYNNSMYVSNDCLTTKLLVLYLILLAEYTDVVAVELICIFPCKAKRWKTFSIKNIALELFSNQKSYTPLYPHLLFLLTNLRPHLFLPYTEPYISIDMYFNHRYSHFPNIIWEDFILFKIFQARNFSALSEFFTRLNNVPIQQMVSFVDIIPPVIRILLIDHSVPYIIKRSFLRIWKKVSVSCPEKCYILTAHYLTSQEDASYFNITTLSKKLMTEPHKLLESSHIIFQNSILVEIFLYTFRYFICLSRVETNKIYKSLRAKTEKTDFNEVNTLYDTLNSTQDLFIILLTILAATQANEVLCERYQSSIPSQAVLCIIGCFIHEFFVANPTLLKLVHYHGYENRSITWIVKYVPSMHIFNGYFPTLMQDVQGEDSLIFLCLTYAHLSTAYPIEQILENLSLFIATLKKLGRSHKKHILLGVLEALSIFSGSFSFSPYLSTAMLSYIKAKTLDTAFNLEDKPKIREKIKETINSINNNLARF